MFRFWGTTPAILRSYCWLCTYVLFLVVPWELNGMPAIKPRSVMCKAKCPNLSASWLHIFYSPPSPTVFILTTNSYKTLQYQKGMLSANNTFLHTQHPLKTATHSIISSTKTIFQEKNPSLVSLAHKHMYLFPTPVCVAIPWALPGKSCPSLYSCLPL